MHFRGPASSWQQNSREQGKGYPCLEKPTHGQSELTPVANLHHTVDFIKQRKGERGKNPLDVSLLAPTLHLRGDPSVTTFPLSAVDATECKVCVSKAPWVWTRWERVEVLLAVHAHESYIAVHRARSFALSKNSLMAVLVYTPRYS